MIALLLPFAVLLLALGLCLPAPAWFPRACYILAAILAGVVIVLMLVSGHGR